MTADGINLNELIKEEYVVPESVFDRKRTKTSHFMLNSIFPNSSLTNTEYFVNAFLDDEETEHKFLYPLFLLFKYSPTDTKWLVIAKRLQMKTEYIMEYFCGIQDGKHLVMMVFQVPKKYAKDYILFKAGKYSQFSDDYKKLFNRYTSNERAEPIESTIWRVLVKHKQLRRELIEFFGDDVKFDSEDELWGIALPKYEHYRHKNKT